MTKLVKKIKKVQVIYKIAERCNLACTYCYYFFMGDESYKDRPAQASRKTTEALADYLLGGIKDLEIELVQLVFHGGEPLMVNKKKFSDMCELFISKLAEHCELQLTVQTNAVLIDSEWVDIFSKYKISVGYSIDGPKSLNDKARIDHKGKGSYDRVVKGVNELYQGWKEGKIKAPGVISVFNHESPFEYDVIYHHIVNELKTRKISILLPDTSHDEGLPAGLDPQYFGQQLAKVFDQWIDNKNDCQFQQAERVLNFFQQIEYVEVALEPNEPNKLMEQSLCAEGFRNGQIIVVQSDATVSVDDSLMAAANWRKHIKPVPMKDMTMQQYVSQSYFTELFDAYSNIPSECEQCCWKNLCRGGDVENRYDTKVGFNRKSVYCASLSYFYAHVVSYLVNHGYPLEKIEQKLEAVN